MNNCLSLLFHLTKALADESEYVRDTALRAGQRIINLYADTAVSVFLPELERGLFDENWRIRYSSIQLLGDLLYKISGVTGKMTTEGGEDDNFGTEHSTKVESASTVLAPIVLFCSVLLYCITLYCTSCFVLYSIVLYYVMFCCIVLYYMVFYCIVLYCIGCVVLYFTVLYCIVCCIVFYCIALCILLYCVVFCCIVLHCVVLYCIVLHCVTWYCFVFWE